MIYLFQSLLYKMRWANCAYFLLHLGKLCYYIVLQSCSTQKVDSKVCPQTLPWVKQVMQTRDRENFHNILALQYRRY